VDTETAANWKTCDAYCNSFDHICVYAGEDSSNGCDAKHEHACSQDISELFGETSDMLCGCEFGGASVGGPYLETTVGVFRVGEWEPNYGVYIMNVTDAATERCGEVLTTKESGGMAGFPLMRARNNRKEYENIDANLEVVASVDDCPAWYPDECGFDEKNGPAAYGNTKVGDACTSVCEVYIDNINRTHRLRWCWTGDCDFDDDKSCPWGWCSMVQEHQHKSDERGCMFPVDMTPLTNLDSTNETLLSLSVRRMRGVYGEFHWVKSNDTFQTHNFYVDGFPEFGYDDDGTGLLFN
jgi:hypothetical protein